jgi:cytochrome c oxidase subunit 2
MSRWALAAVALWLAGCSGRLPALDPAGPQAGRIASYWWLNFWVALVVLAGVLLFLVDTAVRRRAPAGVTALAPRDAHVERRCSVGVSVAVGLTAVTLVGLIVASAATGRGLRALAAEEPAVTVEVTAQQWWWDVEYWDPVPAHRIRTANEIHIPVGRAVLVKTRSLDVNHSFWVPGLHGKQDHIRGHPSSLWIKADHPGTFAGRCAEFCGLQHAHMQLLVIAEPPDAFEAWRRAQRRSAPEPASALARRGRDVFLSGSCALCHAVLGTPAGGRLGPDLTHLASRATLAAGTLPNTPGHLAGWIVDPQGTKPGTRMPANSLGAEELQALLAYLGELR